MFEKNEANTVDWSEMISAPHITEDELTLLNGVFPVVQSVVLSSNVPLVTVASNLESSDA